MRRLARVIDEAEPVGGAARAAESAQDALLGAAEIRRLAASLDLTPAKRWGQNFVHDANTVRRIVRTADVAGLDVVEVGPGLGSLTLGLTEAGCRVTAVEIDPVLAGRLPRTVSERAPRLADNLTVVEGDALAVTADDLRVEGRDPTALVANLPYNVSVPVLLHLLAEVPTLRTALVMVQLEVADRLGAAPGSRVYGVPGVKAGFFGRVRRLGTVGRSVFWPVPNVESGLVCVDAYDEPPWDLGAEHRRRVFGLVDAAFAQRRKTLRAALSGWAGSADAAERALTAAGIDPRTRGERLTTADFVRLAAEAHERGIGPASRAP